MFAFSIKYPALFHSPIFPTKPTAPRQPPTPQRKYGRFEYFFSRCARGLPSGVPSHTKSEATQQCTGTSTFPSHEYESIRAGEFAEVGAFYPSKKTSQVLTAEIIKCFEPFTMAPAMLVRLYHPRYNDQRTYVLKVFDRRFSTQLREQHEIGHYTYRLDTDYHVFSFSQAHHDKYSELTTNRWEIPTIDDDATKEELDDEVPPAMIDETWVQYFCDRMRATEKEFYRRLEDIQGRGIPRYIADVELPLFNASANTYPHGSSSLLLHNVRGILIEYIKGFSLGDMDEEPCPAPRSSWQHIGEDATRVVGIIRNREILNNDSNVRNSVVRLDPIDNKYHAYIIDFGHCDFKPPTMSIQAWRKQQAHQDEEGAIGCVLQRNLDKKWGPGGYIYQESQYAKDLAYDFMGTHKRIGGFQHVVGSLIELEYKVC